MSNVDLEDVERRLAFIGDELNDISLLSHQVARARSEGTMTGWTEGRFSAFVQQARDAVWTARCTVGLVPQKEASHAD
jgi:hypothetical protein